jgi:hypothetical protein
VQGFLYSRPLPATELAKKDPSEMPARTVLLLPRRWA